MKTKRRMNLGNRLPRIWSEATHLPCIFPSSQRRAGGGGRGGGGGAGGVLLRFLKKLYYKRPHKNIN
jgi:hypothetical protein